MTPESLSVDNDVIDLADLPEKIKGGASPERNPVCASFQNGIGFNEAVEQYQKDLIIQALNQTNWVKAKAADLLKMNRTTLVEKIKKMQLEPADGRVFSEDGLPEAIPS